MKIIEANCVTTEYQERRQICFDEDTGLIVSVGPCVASRDKIDFYFNDDCLLFAGMGDVHIHAREDVSQKNVYKEDFTSSRAAMHNGGVTHAGDMPNNPIPPIDNESYEAKLKLAGKTCGEIWIYAGIGPGTRPLSYSVPYKVYMGPSVGELFFKDLDTLDEALVHYQGQSVSFHCEDPELLEINKAKDEHHLRRPTIVESVATKDALNLIEKHKIRGKLCHYSTKSGLDLVRKARARGVNVELEVTPQHLFFSIEKFEKDERVRYQMNPPIRYEEDRLAMMEALKNGEIQYLATDHAPHSEEEKKKGTSGLTGLDTFGVFVTWLLEQGVDAKLIARVAVENPGHFHNRFLESWKRISPGLNNHGKGVGFLKEGYRANFTVLNLRKPSIITKEYLKTKSQDNPFVGFTFPGSLEALFIGGKKA